MEIDSPDVVAEVEAAFAAYEAALVGNDVATLEALFHDDPRTIRYGGAENLYGMEAIRAFRRARSPKGLARTLHRTMITTYGRDHAVASTLFRRASAPGTVGRQSQIWARFPDGWKVVAAHVSVIAEDPRGGETPQPEMAPPLLSTTAMSALRPKGRRRMATIEAEPQPIEVDLARSALLIIDMQRDFLEPGGFGETLGNDIGLLEAAVGPCQAALAAARGAGVPVIHTREGHRPDLSDAPKAKVERGAPSLRIGAPGPMGRILIRGEPGHDIIDRLKPAPGEPVIDKPGKGAFYRTDLELMLGNRGIDTLFVCGVTTEVCVNTTVREANDRGYRCVAIADACASYFPEFHAAGLAMIKAQGGIFGWVAQSDAVVGAMSAPT